MAPIANVPPLEGEVGGDQSGAQISRAATFWAMRSNQFQMGAMRWLALLLTCRWEMGLFLASAVDGAHPHGVKTQPKANTDGDLPLAAETEVLQSVVPCGSGGEVGLAIVPPSPSPLGPQMHDEGVVTRGRHLASVEHRILWRPKQVVTRLRQRLPVHLCYL